MVAGYSELIVYPATSVGAVQRLLVEVGHTRVVPHPARAHLHTFLPESAGLGLGPHTGAAGRALRLSDAAA